MKLKWWQIGLLLLIIQIILVYVVFFTDENIEPSNLFLYAILSIISMFFGVIGLYMLESK